LIATDVPLDLIDPPLRHNSLKPTFGAALRLCTAIYGPTHLIRVEKERSNERESEWPGTGERDTSGFSFRFLTSLPLRFSTLLLRPLAPIAVRRDDFFMVVVCK
jgi:hypothetical protein